MKNRIFIIVSLLLIVTSIFAQHRSQNIAIGTWREHLSYYYTHNVLKAGEEVLVACASSLFYYNPKTNTSKTLSKVQGLSDAGVGVVAYDSLTKATIITYENSNVDIYHNNNVYNIPDIKNRFVEGSKSINNIYFTDGKAFLACGFGVVVIDIERAEIFDTWYVGENSSALAVNSVYSNDTAFFVGTANGVLYAKKDYSTLAASQSWSKLAINNGNSDNVIQYIGNLGKSNILISAYTGVGSEVSVLKYNGSKIDTIIASMYIPFVRSFEDKQVVATWEGCVVYDTNFATLFNIAQTSHPVRNSKADYKDVLVEGNDIWISHKTQGLIYIKDYTKYIDKDTIDPETITFPEGPASIDVYNIAITPKGKVYIAPGGRDAILTNSFLDGNIYYYDGNRWDWINTDWISKNTDRKFYDLIEIAIDPNDETHLMCASWWNGVVEVKNDSVINVYDSSNTYNYVFPYLNSYRVASVKYDKSGNLLIANSLTDHNFAFLTYKGVWGGFNTTNFFTYNDQIKGMIEDEIHHYRLIYSLSGKCIIVNNDSLSIRWINPNNGSLLTTDKLNCMTQDQEGEIWIGTDKGIKVIYSLDNAFNGAGTTAPIECNNIIYTEGIEAQYLLSFEDVQCIMVDGANRKWVGTERGGVYVFSENGDKELYHFTAENSPLLSNKITSMAQHPLTGEVFIGTDRGLISYRPESMPAYEEKQELVVFPNPIRENYQGSIAIKGFVEDSDVRITDAQGRMVAHLKSLGGQAVWDGKNFKGQRVGSGVYYIFSYAEDDAGKTTKADGKFIVIK
ncbi:MAG: hypothetical protein Q4Q06_05210 [Bacteroidota bacterium]|nr:hypothetical protein [Bacteroidota bacterium]